MYGSRQQQMGSGLMRYGSAPSSLLTSLVDSGDEFSATGSENLMGRFFSGDSSCLTSESSCRVNVSSDLDEINAGQATCPAGFSGNGDDLKKNQCLAGEGGQRNEFCESEMVFRSQGPESHLESSFCLNPVAVGNFSTASSFKNAGNGPLIRHSSSPAGFFSHLTVDNGFSVGGIGNFNCETSSNCGHGVSSNRLKSQMSFSRQGPLSQVPEISIPDVGESIADRSSPEDGSFGSAGNISQSYISGSFQMGLWEECNPIVFSADPRKRASDINGEIVHGLTPKDSQFSLPTTSMEMAAVEKVLQNNQDYVPCKIRARRGFATHPRSIAERERRTRISEKLRKLQELVPNMDKQTNYADMLDLAVQHIKVLQNQVQKLNQERANCACSDKQLS